MLVILLSTKMMYNQISTRKSRFFSTNGSFKKRLKRMNKRLDAILGQRAAEKRGKNWELTSFMRDTWDSTKEEMEREEEGKTPI